MYLTFGNNLRHQEKLELNLESTSAERLADKSNKIQQTIPLQRSTASWAALSSVTSRSREVILPLCTALVHKCSAVSPHRLPVDLLE